MNKILLITCFVITSIFSGAALAAKPGCSSEDGGYCSYTGKVKRVYITSRGFILMYFEERLDPAAAQSAGYTITNDFAASYKVSEDPDFAKMLYSTLLAATSQDRKVSIQMRGTYWGYMKIDRIWFGH